MYHIVVHRVLAADIEENVILKMDIINTYGFGLVLKQHIFLLGSTERILHH